MKLITLLQTHATLSPPFSLLQFPTTHSSLPHKPITPSSNSYSFLLRRRRRRSLRSHTLKHPNFKVIGGGGGGSVKEEHDCSEPDENAELPVVTCITRTLPPALTLEHGLRKIKESVDELKSNPPNSASGMYRFQVAVPPSPKALNWFCCQPDSSGVFPQFFLSKKKDNSTARSLSSSALRGVFGIGAAVLFKGSSSCSSAEWSSIQRYLQVDSSSTPVTAYGFVDVNFDIESSSMNQTKGSFYLFIPEWRAALHMYTLLK